MFTGIVECAAPVLALEARGEGGARLALRVPFADALAPGASLAVNGVCLSAVPDERADEAGALAFDLLAETLRRSDLGALRPGDLVNLERPLRADGRLDGHFVLGHVDATAPIIAMDPDGPDVLLRIALPERDAELIAEKGSIAVDGISLTVAALGERDFACAIIPTTLERTNLHSRRPGEAVNLEFDVIARHLRRLAQHAA